MKTPDVLLPALRQYQHNDCSGLISGFEHKETCKIVTGLQAKLRELAEAAEWRNYIEWFYDGPKRIKGLSDIGWYDIYQHENCRKTDAEAAYQAALKAAKGE